MKNPKVLVNMISKTSYFQRISCQGKNPLLSKTLLKARIQEESSTAIRVFRVVCVVRVPKKPQLERGRRCEHGQHGRKRFVPQRFRQQREKPRQGLNANSPECNSGSMVNGACGQP